jgi:hypothetical protein
MRTPPDWQAWSVALPSRLSNQEMPARGLGKSLISPSPHERQGSEMRSLPIAVVIVASVSVHAQSPAFQRGDLVRVKAADGHPTTTLVLTVVAAPRDRIRLADSTVYVNDVAVSAFSPDFLARAVHHHCVGM